MIVKGVLGSLPPCRSELGKWHMQTDSCYWIACVIGIAQFVYGEFIEENAESQSIHGLVERMGE